MSTAVLQVDGLTKAFGGVAAVSDVSLQVGETTLHGLIGPNGAGKSTLLALVSGFHRPDAGTVRLAGADVTGRAAAALSRAGLARTFQAATPFPGLTVLENVLVGFHGSGRAGLVGSIFRPPAVRREERDLRERAIRLLEQVGLADSAHVDAGSLSFGQLRLLEVARALATSPRLLLLDEPAAGLNAVESTRLAALLRTIRESGTAVLVIDHDVPFLFGLCEEVLVMDAGRVIASGSPASVADDPAVRAAYLSVDAKTEPADQGRPA